MFVCTCDKCGWKDYRLHTSQAQLNLLRNMGEQGTLTCYHCQKGNMIVKQLKWKDIQKLHKKFPNKKALFTNLTVEELLALPDDLTVDPNIVVDKKED